MTLFKEIATESIKDFLKEDKQQKSNKKTKPVININENQLRQIVSETVKKILKEEKTDWNQIRQSREDNFWDTLEYYMGLKDERGYLSPEQLSDAQDVCDKLSCFGEDTDEFCEYAREYLGLD